LRLLPEKIGIEAIFALYNAAFEQEQKALDIIPKSEFSEQIENQDKVRDNLARGFSDAVKSARNHFDAKIRDAANSLWRVFSHYGNVAVLSLDAETAAIDDMMRELDGEANAAALETLGLTNWRDNLKAENAKFHQLMMNRYNEATTKTTLRMKTARVETDKYYRAMVSQTEIQLLLGNNDAVFGEFVTELNAIIKRFKDLQTRHLSDKA
jgi:hypothetical protein